MAGGHTRSMAPVRVVVMGASATVDTSFSGGPRSDVGYPRVLEAALLAAGVPARVRVSAAPANRLRHGLRSWFADVEQYDPDVVVLHFGQADSVHLLLPRWLERHANSPRRRPFAIREAYRKVVLRPAWKALAQLQRQLDGRVDGTRVRRRQRRAARQLAELVDRTRATTSSLVLVPTLLRPGPPWQSWFPGVGPRMATLNRLFGEVVAETGDPDVRTFPLAELVLAGLADGEEPTPDGGHFTPRVHHQVGEALAEVVLAWLPTRPHLPQP